MIALERKTKPISRKFLHEVSSKVGLPVDVCATLIESGWTLEFERNQPAKWVQGWPKVELPEGEDGKWIKAEED
jgi:hypothetical protein